MTTAQFPDDPRQVARGIDDNGDWVFEQVGIQEISFAGRFGTVAHSSTSNDISIGDKVFTIELDDGSFRISDDVLITSLTDPACFMWGEVVNKTTNSLPAELTIYVDDISDLIGNFSDWELQVVARPKPGIEKDVSTSTVTIPDIDSDVNTMTFTITADKFFPIGGKLLIKDLTNRTKALIGKVYAYNGTTLVVDVVAKTASASGISSSWSIALLDAPQDKVPKYAINGLKILINATDPTHDIDITPGTVRDSTDTVDLTLTSTLTKRLDATFTAGTNQGAQVQSANLVGTAALSFGTISGAGGTDFVNDFTTGTLANASLDDLDNQYLVWKGAVPAGFKSIMTIGSTTVALSSVTDADTASTLALSTIGATTYKRGGWVVSGVNAPYAITLIRKDSDGSVDVCACALHRGSPDLPSGYTYYRVIGLTYADGFGLHTTQPIQALSSASSDDISIDTSDWTSLPSLSSAVTQPTASLQDVLNGTDFGFDAAFSQIALKQDADGDLTALAGITGTGYATRTAGNTWALRSFQAGQNIAITANAGVATDTTIAVNMVLDNGSYTPTAFTPVNLDSTPTPATQDYIRVGDRVIVYFAIPADPTLAAGTTTSFDINLPINPAAVFGGGGAATGHCASRAGTFVESGRVYAVTGQRRVTIEWNSLSTAQHAMYGSFMYRL